MLPFIRILTCTDCNLQVIKYDLKGHYSYICCLCLSNIEKSVTLTVRWVKTTN